MSCNLHGQDGSSLACQANNGLSELCLQRDLVPTCRELGIAILAYSPMSRGLLTEGFSVDKLPAADFRLYQPRFSQGNLEQVWALPLVSVKSC